MNNLIVQIVIMIVGCLCVAGAATMINLRTAPPQRKSKKLSLAVCNLSLFAAFLLMLTGVFEVVYITFNVFFS